MIESTLTLKTSSISFLISGFFFLLSTCKTKIKKQIEETFDVKVDSVNSLIRLNKKYVYAKLNKKNPAIDVATKLGMI